MLEEFPSLRSIEFNFRINYEALLRKFEGQAFFDDADIDVQDDEEMLAQEDFLQKSYQSIDAFVAAIAASKKNLSVKGFLVAEGYSFSMIPVEDTPLRRGHAEALEDEHNSIDNYLLHYIERPGTTVPTGCGRLWNFHELVRTLTAKRSPTWRQWLMFATLHMQLLSEKEVGEFNEERFQKTLRENLEIEAHWARVEELEEQDRLEEQQWQEQSNPQSRFEA